MNINLKDYLFLFDIDGTIISAAGAGKKAFLSAFEILFNVKISTEVNFLGGIDLVVFNNLYKDCNLSKTGQDAKWEEFKSQYLKLLKQASKNDNWFIIPGADKAIKLLSENSNVGLVTGNIKKGAEIKLNKFSLDSYFKCGGYGDEIIYRKEIVKQAIYSSREFFKKDFANDKIFLFGDTKSDIDSAFENSIQPVLIDPDNKHNDNIKNWNVKYRGSFLNIDRFILEIAGTTKSKSFCFC